MNKVIIMVVIAISMISCANEDSFNNTTGIFGKWKLTEVLIDNGNGNGIFQTTNIDKTFTFYTNSTFKSTSATCNEGVFLSSRDAAQSSGAIVPQNCPNTTKGDILFYYRLNGNELIIRYQCSEYCAEKYIKIDNSALD